MMSSESILTTSNDVDVIDNGIDYQKLGTIDFDNLWQETILSQYSNSESIKTILEGLAQLIDPKPAMKVFYDKIFNIGNTALCSEIGAKIWSNIVAMSNANGVDVAQGNFFGYDTLSDDRYEEVENPASDINPKSKGWYEKVANVTYVIATIQSGDNPSEKGWYENIGGQMVATSDTEVPCDEEGNPLKQYYVASVSYSYVLTERTVIDPSNPVTFYKRKTLQGNSSFQPFNQAPFVYDEPGSGRFKFSSEDLSVLVLAKALANITTASLPNLKKFMKAILGSNNFAVDNLHNAVGGGNYAYVRVEPAAGDNPHAKGWYEEMSNGDYKLTDDTEVYKNPLTGQKKHYYKQVNAVMAVKFVICGSKPVTLELFKLHAPIVVGAGVKIYYQSTGANFFGFEGSDLSMNFDNGVFFDEAYGGWAFGEL